MLSLEGGDDVDDEDDEKKENCVGHIIFSDTSDQEGISDEDDMDLGADEPPQYLAGQGHLAALYRIRAAI